MTRQMSDAQIAAIAKFERLRVGALFMEMGTGKTLVALDLMASRASKCDLFVWVCPCALKGEIERERLKWHPELDIRVVGCESIGSSERIYGELRKLLDEHSCVFMVVDESLKIKNAAAKRTRRICELAQHTHYRLILNGTPISRDVLDLWTQMYFLSPKILNCSRGQFMRRYCDMEFEQGRSPRVKAVRNMEHLASVIEPYIFEAKLYLDVDRESVQSRYYISESEYKALKASILNDMDDSDEMSEIDFYTLITKLQRWYTPQSSHHTAIRAELESIGNEQSIVFVKYVETIPDGAVCMTGATPQHVRDVIVKRFLAGEVKTLWLTYGIGAYGLNLQSAHHVIFAEHTWDYAQRVQAEARVYRMGQRETVVVHDIICANAGLEGLILSNIARKERTASHVSRAINDIKANL